MSAPWWGGRGLVPFRELPEAGVGDYAAEAIRAELTLRPPEEPYGFGSRIGWKHCMNCGLPKPDVADRGGWCGDCEGA